MRAKFESNHVAGDFSSGALTVRIVREDDEQGVSRDDEIFFEVPADFHTHNDSVAAALMTLVGERCRVATFNFPISEHCAGILRDYYGLDEVGPIDPSLEPRQKGRYLGLLLSGGTDSMAVWELLRRVLGDEFKVITIAFGGGFAFEELGFGQVKRDVSCRTDFRRKGFAEHGRFTTSVPLLFADYLDLGRITTGHHYNHIPNSTESLREGQPPAFLVHDHVVNAGGLDEVHLVRGLQSVALQMLAMLLEPALLEASLRGSAPPGSSKHFFKGHVFRYLFERQDRAIPGWLEDVTPFRRRRPPLAGITPPFAELHLLKRCGRSVADAVISDLASYDLSIVDELQMTFMERYDTNLSQLIPADLRHAVLRVFHEAAIYPFDERDFDEVERVRDYGRRLATGEARRARSPRTPTVVTA